MVTSTKSVSETVILAEQTPRIAVIGLGYVGLPLAVAFAEHFEVVGYDISETRISELKQNLDRTLEVSNSELASVGEKIAFTAKEEELAQSNFFIVTVPTPVDKFNNPDLSLLVNASQTVGKFLEKGDIVVFESTVFPGATEEVCVPELERSSGLKLNDDFWVGYSPERINPGDPDRKVADIVKVTSGSDPRSAELIDKIYAQIVTVGTHLAPDIKTAEAAKIIENTQRDVNIALMNEWSAIFRLLNIDTNSVLEAASTKWNFLKFYPGLVGGHCIGVDPYYLTHKAKEVGYHPDVILSGRRINDGLGRNIAQHTLELLYQRKTTSATPSILILGVTFKENCPDVRNSKVFDMIKYFDSQSCSVTLFDPHADPQEVEAECNKKLEPNYSKQSYDAVILAVPHSKFQDATFESLKALTHSGNGPIVDIRGVLDNADYRL